MQLLFGGMERVVLEDELQHAANWWREQMGAATADPVVASRRAARTNSLQTAAAAVTLVQDYPAPLVAALLEVPEEGLNKLVARGYEWFDQTVSKKRRSQSRLARNR